MDLKQGVQDVLSKKILIYFGIMFLLVIVSIVNFFVDSPYTNLIDFIIIFFFFLDTCYQIKKSESAWQYIRSHPLDFVALIPISGSFRTFKAIPLGMQALRFTSIGKRYFFPVVARLKQTGIGRAFWYFVLLIFLLPLPLLWYEPAIKNYGTLLWWTLNTVTTVGYGDIVIKTSIGRVIASILMILGVGLISTVTSSIIQMMTNPLSSSTKFKRIPRKQEQEKNSRSSLQLEEIEQLQQLLIAEKERILTDQENLNNGKE